MHRASQQFACAAAVGTISAAAQQRLERGIVVAVGCRERALSVLFCKAHLSDALHLGGVVAAVARKRLGPVAARLVVKSV